MQRQPQDSPEFTLRPPNKNIFRRGMPLGSPSPRHTPRALIPPLYFKILYDTTLHGMRHESDANSSMDSVLVADPIQGYKVTKKDSHITCKMLLSNG